MKLSRLNLNYYSFGYLGGFIDKSVKKMSPNELIRLAKKYKLGGIEFPVDHLYKDYSELDCFLREKDKMNYFISIENFKVETIKSIVPYLKKNNIHSARIKMSNYFGGNRYRVKDFKSKYNMFINDLILLRPFLLYYDFRLLIENHQDLNSHDILNIIDKVSRKCIGVNWDIGNSIATGETPINFYNNVKDQIFNIHIKDYKILLKKKSLELHRCSIGEGNIGIDSVLYMLLNDDYAHSMSIELGAHKKRISNIFNKKYWDMYPDYNKNHKSEYFNYINSVVKKLSVLINNNIPSKKLELYQLEKSIKNLKNI